jgi:cysteine sulfinate desulfinase/cysteine desulfurase-like protein
MLLHFHQHIPRRSTVLCVPCNGFVVSTCMHILSFRCCGLQDIAVSSGSACTSASLEPSYVLRALGVEEDMAHTSIRWEDV